MKIVLPWPDVRLTPNAKRRKHWRAYQPVIKADRHMGYVQTLSQLHLGIRDIRAAFKGAAKLDCTISFYPPDHRKRDDDGAISAFKHLRDGMCDALCIDDHRLRPSYTMCEPDKPGRVEVHFG